MPVPVLIVDGLEGEVFRHRLMVFVLYLHPLRLAGTIAEGVDETA